jgi:hypothetical protein
MDSVGVEEQRPLPHVQRDRNSHRLLAVRIRTPKDMPVGNAVPMCFSGGIEDTQETKYLDATWKREVALDG